MINYEWIDRDEYPFKPRGFKVPAGNLHYVDEGSGSPVFMVHGNPAWSFLFRKLIKRLRPGYRCVAMDHLGFGLSDKPRDWSYVPQDHAANLAALIEGLGLKDITLVVQDWGGPIGFSYAVDHPENVARIVIMNTWAWPVHRDPHYMAFSSFMGGPIGRTLIRRYNFFARTVMRKAFGDPHKLSADVHRHYLKALAAPEDRTGCLVFPRQIIAATPWLGQLWSAIPVLRHKPVQIIWGMKDIAFREKELRRWQHAFPDARTLSLPCVGHFVMEEAPEEVCDAVDSFLAG